MRRRSPAGLPMADKHFRRRTAGAKRNEACTLDAACHGTSSQGGDRSDLPCRCRSKRAKCRSVEACVLHRLYRPAIKKTPGHWFLGSRRAAQQSPGVPPRGPGKWATQCGAGQARRWRDPRLALRLRSLRSGRRQVTPLGLLGVVYTLQSGTMSLWHEAPCSLSDVGH